MNREHWIIAILLFLLIFVSGCTSYQPKYEVGDIITNTEGGPCYGYFIEGYHGGADAYMIKNLTRCDATNNPEWKHVGDNPRREEYIRTDFNPLITKIGHLDNINGIPGPYRTTH
ncbi:hypothetical protein EHM76_02180 [bacterium]|nr:MAG: hypothetical protein EHM76_02180 [bacterium]